MPIGAADCNVYRNVGQFSSFEAAHPRQTKLYTDSWYSMAGLGIIGVELSNLITGTQKCK